MHGNVTGVVYAEVQGGRQLGTEESWGWKGVGSLVKLYFAEMNKEL